MFRHVALTVLGIGVILGLWGLNLHSRTKDSAIGDEVRRALIRGQHGGAMVGVSLGLNMARRRVLRTRVLFSSALFIVAGIVLLITS
jgi:hypothetical protein